MALGQQWASIGPAVEWGLRGLTMFGESGRRWHLLHAAHWMNPHAMRTKRTLCLLKIHGGVL
jgi:hypothetical protein